MSEKTFEFDTERWAKIVDLSKVPDNYREDILYLILISRTLLKDNEDKLGVYVDEGTYVSWSPQDCEGFVYSVEWDRVLGFDFMGSYYRVYCAPQGVAETAATFRRRFVLEALSDL